MSITLRQAKQLCTASEFELVEASFDRRLSHLTVTRVKQKITLSRKLRDKYRGLAERQRRESRGKQGPRGARPSQSNQRTAEKQQLFDETMERFQRKLERIESAEDPEAGRGSTSKPASKAGPAGKPEAARGRSASREARRAERTAEKVIAEKRQASAAAGRRGKRTANAGEITQSDPVAPRAKRRRMKSFVAKLPHKQSQLAESARLHIVGHLGTATRHNQARRDSRN